MEKKISLYECLERIEKGKAVETPAKKKTVKENWTEWKKLNTPRFDLDGYRSRLERFIKTLCENQIVNSGEIESVKFAYPQKMTNVTSYTMIGEWTAKYQITPDKAPIMCAKIIDRYKELLGDKMAEMMPETMMSIVVPETANNSSNQFYKYIDTLVEKPNENRIHDMEYIAVKNLLNEAKESGYELFIKTADFMEHFNEINEMFS